MTDDLLSNPRLRRLAFGAFLLVSSVLAGYGVYQGKLKILAILGLFTLGFLLRQASVRNAYWLCLTCLQLALVTFGPIREEFETDRWLGLAFMVAVSGGVALVNAAYPAWPGVAHLLVAALLTLAAASSSWSPDPRLSFAKAGAVGMVFTVAFVGLWSHGVSVAKVREIADVHVDMLWIVFPLGMFLWVIGWPGVLMAGRLTSIFENPNALGVWCSLSLPLLLGLAFSHPVEWRRKLCWAMLALGGMVALLSGSRGGVLGAFIGMGVYAGLRWSRWVLAGTLAVSVVTVFLVLYEVDVIGRSDILMTLVRPETLEDLSDRKIWWQVGVMIAEQKPWLGHGFGIGPSLFASYGVDVAFGTFGASIHSAYLTAWMEIGYLGTALIIACSAWCIGLGLLTWKRDPNGEGGLLALALAGSALGIAAHSAVESILTAAGNPWMLPYWVTLALLARLHRLQRDAAARAGEAARRRAPAGLTAPTAG